MNQAKLFSIAVTLLMGSLVLAAGKADIQVWVDEQLRAIDNIEVVYAENIYFATLKMKKENLNPLKGLFNDIRAVEQEIPIGKNDFDTFYYGQTLSSKFDFSGLFSDTSFATYKVEVSGKREDIHYFIKTKGSQPFQINYTAYDLLITALQAKFSSRINYYQFSGHQVFRVLDRDIDKFTIKEFQPIVKTYSTIQIENDTIFTGSFLKLFRNSNLKHQIEIESPSSSQLQSLNFDSGLSIGTAFLSGRLSSMKGTVVGTRNVNEAGYHYGITNEGIVLVLPIQAAKPTEEAKPVVNNFIPFAMLPTQIKCSQDVTDVVLMPMGLETLWQKGRYLRIVHHDNVILGLTLYGPNITDGINLLRKNDTSSAQTLLNTLSTMLFKSCGGKDSSQGIKDVRNFIGQQSAFDQEQLVKILRVL